jgi:hypothetical protein
MHSCLDISKGNALSTLITFLVIQLSQAQVITCHDAVALDKFLSLVSNPLVTPKVKCEHW